MTQKAFIKILDEKGYSYEIEGDKVVVTHEGDVGLDALTSIPPGVEFKNGGYVDLESLTSLPPGVEFKNGEDVYLVYLVGGWFGEWQGNIEGIAPERLLNLMISKGVFER